MLGPIEVRELGNEGYIEHSTDGAGRLEGVATVSDLMPGDKVEWVSACIKRASGGTDGREYMRKGEIRVLGIARRDWILAGQEFGRGVLFHRRLLESPRAVFLGGIDSTADGETLPRVVTTSNSGEGWLCPKSLYGTQSWVIAVSFIIDDVGTDTPSPQALIGIRRDGKGDCK